jgi:hypothetical protein
LATEVNARMLFPFRWAGIASAAGAINPLLSANAAIIYAPSASHLTFLQASLNYNLAENWDISAFSQIAAERSENKPSLPLKSLFFRTQWSF